jgi:hypothetical protein
MFTTAQAVDIFVQVVETDVEVPWISPRRFEPEPGRPEDASGHDREAPETDERRQLSQFVQG